MDPLVTLRDQLFEAAQRAEAASRSPKRSRLRPSHPLAVFVAGVLAAGGAVGAAAALTGQRSAPLSGTINTHKYEIAVSPYLQAGASGWCVSVSDRTRQRFLGAGEQCGGVPGVPIVAESFGGPNPKWSTLNWAITTSQVSAVRFGDRVVSTRSEPRLPNGFKAAVEVVAPGQGPARARQRAVRRVGGYISVVSRPVPVEALNAQGQAIPSGKPWPRPRPTTVPRRTTVYWAPPQAPPSLPCSLHSGAIPGLEPQWGTVATRLARVPGAPSAAFLSCVDTEFYWDHWALEAAVLLDADQPGSEPAALPQMHEVPGHPGVFDAPGGVQGDLTARRIGDTWLVVQGGDGLEQRLAVLSDLTVTSPAPLWR